jgi:hypothetical protein
MLSVHDQKILYAIDLSFENTQIFDLEYDDEVHENMESIIKKI